MKAPFPPPTWESKFSVVRSMAIAFARPASANAATAARESLTDGIVCFVLVDLSVRVRRRDRRVRE